MFKFAQKNPQQCFCQLALVEHIETMEECNGTKLVCLSAVAVSGMAQE